MTMRRTMRAVSFSAVLICVVAVVAPALAASFDVGPQQSPNDPSSVELVERFKEFDGEEITFTGEAITEALERGDMAWVHVNDDAYYLKNVEEGARLGGYNSGHAVWLPRDLAEKITHFGDYTHEGDVVTVEGVFNAACSEHGGDMDIHATSLVVDRVGHRVHEPVKPLKALVALVLAVLSAALWMATRRVEHRELGGMLGR